MNGETRLLIWAIPDAITGSHDATHLRDVNEGKKVLTRITTLVATSVSHQGRRQLKTDGYAR